MLGIFKKRWFQVIGVLVFFIVFGIIMWRVQKNPSSQVPDIACEVSGEKITNFQFQAAINRRITKIIATSGRFSAADKEDVMLSVMKALVNDKMLEIFSKKEGVKSTEEDVEKKKQDILNLLEKKYKSDQKKTGQTPRMDPLKMYETLWRMQGFRTEGEFREDLKKEILEDKLAEKLFPLKSYTVSEQEIDDYMPTVALRQIFFVFDRTRPKNMEINFSDRKTWERAWDVYNQLKAGSDFCKLAEGLSQDLGTAKNCGGIGYIAKKSVDNEFWRVASTMKPGDITEPFTTRYGIHILKCLDSRNPRDAVYGNLRSAIKRGVLVKKQRGDFIAWFYRKFRSLNENNKIVFYNPVLKANQLKMKGKANEAIEEYKKAIENDKEGAPYYHIDIAMIYASLMKYSDSLKELRIATELAPTDPLLFYRLGVGYMEVGENDQALAEFQKASDMSKLNYELHNQLEQIYMQLGLVELADKEHQLSLKAIEVLSGGTGGTPGAMFKSPEYKLPTSGGAGVTGGDSGSPESVRESPIGN